ncbi:MAG: transposase [Candidatus Paceibacterota bacterium]
MPKRNVDLARGEYYHIYNRGNSKQKIFRDKADYDRFVKYLYLCNSNKNINFRDNIVSSSIDAFSFERGQVLVSIGAWVLMPNHFHLYLSISLTPGVGREEGEGGKNEITDFMHKLSSAYAKYFNEKYKRTGSLFEGRFKAVLVTKDNQAKYLFSYIHLNPIKLIQKDWKEKGVKSTPKALEFLESYKWSSYLDYAGETRKENLVLDRKNFLNYFGNVKEFKKDIFEWFSPHPA